MFVAVEVPAAIRDRAVGIASQLPRGARVVPADNMHITMAFMGETDAGSVDDIREALGRVAFRSFRVGLRGFGAFSSRPRVVFAMIADGSEDLSALNDEVVRALAPFASRMRLDAKRGFVPHITVARIGHTDRGAAGDVLAFIEAHKDEQLGDFTCSGFKLKRSVLTTSGAVHSDVCAFGGAGED